MKKHSRFLSLIMALVLIGFTQGIFAQTQPEQGDGSTDKPFLIGSAAELLWYAQYVNGTSGDNTVHPTACAKLTADIDLSTVCSSTKGSWTPIAAYNISNKVVYGPSANHYSGTFDGQGYTISKLYINTNSTTSINNILGFFGYTYSGSIKNFKMSDVYVSAPNAKNTGNAVGSVVGSSYITAIQNIEVVSGSVEGWSNVGGIAGIAGKISKCTNRATVRGRSTVGGIISAHSESTSDINKIDNCINYGSINIYYEVGIAGGICGTQKYASETISNCSNYGDVTIESTVTSLNSGVGGILGHGLNGDISNCNNYGNVIVDNTSFTEGKIGSIIGDGSYFTVSGIIVNGGELKVNGTQTSMAAFGNATGGTSTATIIMPTTKYTVTFNLLQKGTNFTQEVYSGAYAVEPTDPVCFGYTFGGWYTDESCINEFKFTSTTITANRTLYAKWTITPTAILDGCKVTFCNGWEYSELNNKLSLGSFDNGYLDASKIGLVDITGATLTGDAVAISLTNPNTMIKANSGQIINDKNVIVDDVCANFVLDDWYDFYCPKDFTATSGTYTRTISNGVGTYVSVCMPFALTSTQLSGAKIMKFSEKNDDYITFTVADNIDAGVPCIVKIVNAGNWSVEFDNTPIVSMVDNSGYMKGSFTEQSIGAGLYKLTSDGTVYGMTYSSSNPVIYPFRSYLDLTGLSSSAKSLNIVLSDLESTGVGAIDAADILTGSVVYSLNGMMKSSLGCGLNIVKYADGSVHKIIVK